MMRDIKFDIQDLDLDEGGMFHELVITHQDGSASFIMSDAEFADLYMKTRERWQKQPTR